MTTGSAWHARNLGPLAAQRAGLVMERMGHYEDTRQRRFWKIFQLWGKLWRKSPTMLSQMFNQFFIFCQNQMGGFHECQKNVEISSTWVLEGVSDLVFIQWCHFKDFVSHSCFVAQQIDARLRNLPHGKGSTNKTHTVLSMSGPRLTSLYSDLGLFCRLSTNWQLRQAGAT